MKQGHALTFEVLICTRNKVLSSLPYGSPGPGLIIAAAHYCLVPEKDSCETEGTCSCKFPYNSIPKTSFYVISIAGENPDENHDEIRSETEE